MAVFSYSKIADYILDQFWGFANANSLKNSLRYIAEDVLGDPSTNSDKPSSTAANNFREKTTRSTGTSPGLGGVAISSSSGTFTLIATTTYTDVTNLTVTLVTSGRPIFVGLISDGSANSAFGVDKSTATSVNIISGSCKIVRDSTDLTFHQFTHAWNPADTNTNHAHYVPCGSVNHIDAVAAGTYVYKLQVACGTVEVRVIAQRMKLIAFEL